MLMCYQQNIDKACSLSLKTYFCKLKGLWEIWEGLGLISYWKLEVLVLGFKVLSTSLLIMFVVHLNNGRLFTTEQFNKSAI